jgi:hypothetical protein
LNFHRGDYSHLNIFKRAQKGRFTEVYKSFEEEKTTATTTAAPNALALGREVAEPQINKEAVGGRGDYYIGTNDLFDDASRGGMTP